MILYVLFGLFIITNSLKKNKLCLNCKFYYNSGRCLLFTKNIYKSVSQKKSELDNLLKNGKQSQLDSLDYYSCLIARDNENMCGKDGKKYQDKNNFKFNILENLK